MHGRRLRILRIIVLCADSRHDAAIEEQKLCHA